MSAAQILTANEVAALSGLDEGRIRKEVEYGIFARPNFTFADLVYFAVLAVLGVQLGVDDRRKLHDLVAGAMGPGRRPSRVEFSPVLEVLRFPFEATPSSRDPPRSSGSCCLLKAESR